MTEPTDAEIYAQYFDANGQPIRRGAVLTPEDQAIYDQYFAPTTNQTITEETHQ